MKNFIILILLSATAFSSCKKDFELNAPYRETMVVYGLLNLRDSVQYVRISKAFLGEGNALVTAQIPDSINYDDVLDVSIEELNNGIVINTLQLERTDTIPKDAGVFASPEQVYFLLRNHTLNASYQYRLIARNTQTGYTASSLTRLVEDVNMINPSVSDVDFASAAQFSVKFNPGDNSRIYDVIIRFHYTEDSAGVLSYHMVDWNFPDQYVTTSPEISFPYFRPDFYVLLGSEILVKAGVIRRPGSPASGNFAVEYRVIAGTEDLYTYQQLNSPSNTSIQDPPLFTTVENGIGLFTSRLIHSEFRNLNSRSNDSLKTGVYTAGLNFIY